MKSGPLGQKSMRLYVLLHTLTRLVCWGWFVGLWTIAFVGFTLANFEWWLLVGAACAGVYGLLPNLEKAIDTAWLKGIGNPTAIAERVAELRPVKRRIDIVFSIAVFVIILCATVLFLLGLVQFQTV